MCVGKQRASPIHSLPSAGSGVGTDPLEAGMAGASSPLSSDCIFLSTVRPKGIEGAKNPSGCPSDREGENKNNVLAEAKQNIFNSRPQKKNS